MRPDTDQERFWAGDFGDHLIDRTDIPVEIDDNLRLFKRILSSTGQIRSIVEFGPYIGLNLRVLKTLIPEAELSAVEINDQAIGYLNEWGRAKVYHESLFDFSSGESFDLVLNEEVPDSYTSYANRRSIPDNLRILETVHMYLRVF